MSSEQHLLDQLLEHKKKLAEIRLEKNSRTPSAAATPVVRAEHIYENNLFQDVVLDVVRASFDNWCDFALSCATECQLLHNAWAASVLAEKMQTQGEIFATMQLLQKKEDCLPLSSSSGPENVRLLNLLQRKDDEINELQQVVARQRQMLEQQAKTIEQLDHDLNAVRCSKNFERELLDKLSNQQRRHKNGIEELVSAFVQCKEELMEQFERQSANKR